MNLLMKKSTTLNGEKVKQKFLSPSAYPNQHSLNIPHNMYNNVLYAEKLRNMQKYALLTFDIVIRDAQNKYKNVFACL